MGGFNVLESNINGVTLELFISSYRIENGDETLFEIEGAGIDKNGLPIFGTLLAIPHLRDVEVEIIPEEVKVERVKLPEEIGELPSYVLSPPMIFRDLRVRALGVRPFRYDPQNERLLIYKKTKIRVRFMGVDTRNTKTLNGKISHDFIPLYRSILNFDENIFIEERGGYIIVVPDELIDEIEPFVNWKNLLGYKTLVIPLSNIGSNPSAQEIKDYISQIYFSQYPRPEYLLLFGDTNMDIGGGIPTFHYGPDADDLEYGLMEGDDYLPEMIVGRISVENEIEASLVVAKTLGYEKNPYMEETDWYRRALVVAGVYIQTELVNTTRLTKLWVRENLLDFGFSEVDTVFYYATTGSGGDSLDITASINEGVTIVNYRGWGNIWGWEYPAYKVSHLNLLQNGWKLPVMFSIVCGTGNFAAPLDPTFGEAWIRAGIPSNPPQPKGGVAFMGPTNPDTHTRWNNAIDVGIFEGILRDSIWHFGPAGIRGLMELIRGFPDRASPGDSTGVEFNFHIYSMQGDPSLFLWTDIPESLNVLLPSFVAIGNSGITIRVESTGGNPVSGAYVSLYKEDEIHIGKLTDPQGYALFNVELTTPGTLYVTVSGRNLVPYIGEIPVYESGMYVGIDSYEVIDSSTGNGDGKINPGETVELGIILKNFGNSSTAPGVIAILRSQDTSITILDSLVSYGDIPPGGTSYGDDNFTILTSPFLRDGESKILTLEIQSGDSIWFSYIEEEIYSSRIRLREVYINDAGGNGYLEPGESGSITLKVENVGRVPALNTVGHLRPRYTGISITDSISTFGNLEPGDTTTGPPFNVYIMPDAAYGRKVSFQVEFQTDLGIERRVFWLTLGPLNPSVPGGPDAYGYWAYDIVDTLYDEVPEYNWIEIDPNYGGDGTLILSDNDGIATLNLPFTFKYYGNDYQMLTVSSNGWIAFDTTNQFSPRNWPIPSPFGPSNLVAIFWDDLDPGDSGGVYYKYDSQNNRFIIEWSRVLNRYDYSSIETFELILLDPAHYPTITGDGELIFQYFEVNNVDSSHYLSTVGIEDKDHSTGIQYVYGTFYDSTSLVLQSGLAIKFTTDPPDTYLASIREGETERVKEKIFKLSTAPNPSPGKVNIFLTVEKKGNYSLSVYDVSGRFIENLYNGSLEPGTYIFEWSGESNGRRVGRGVYFILLEGEFRKTKKVVLLR
jgi:hypothetical protein